MLSLGVIDGRNIWRTNLQRALSLVGRAAKTLGPERVLVDPSGSLLDSPVDVDLETRLDTQEDLLRKALCVLAPSQLWVNPDCGLKTRRWEEVRPALTAMVQAGRKLRESQDGNSKHLR